MSMPVLLQRDGAIATVTINRAAVRNTLDRAAWHKLGEVMVRVSVENDLRCIVLRGAGLGAFCGGDDVAAFTADPGDAQSVREYAGIVARTLDSLRECRHPVLAMVAGECTGAGLVVAALADLRICADTSRFVLPVSRVGAVLGHDALAPLAGLIGRGPLMEMLLTGSGIDAVRAHGLGLAQRVVDEHGLAECAYETARGIAAGAPLAARWHKKFLNRLDHPTPVTAAERDEALLCFGTTDFQEGLRAFLDARPPRFRGH